MQCMILTWPIGDKQTDFIHCYLTTVKLACLQKFCFYIEIAPVIGSSCGVIG